jgi:hypothetical protein
MLFKLFAFVKNRHDTALLSLCTSAAPGTAPSGLTSSAVIKSAFLHQWETAKRVPYPGLLLKKGSLISIHVCVLYFTRTYVFYFFLIEILTVFAVFVLLSSGRLLPACYGLDSSVRYFDSTERDPRSLEVVWQQYRNQWPELPAWNQSSAETYLS